MAVLRSMIEDVTKEVKALKVVCDNSNIDKVSVHRLLDEVTYRLRYAFSANSLIPEADKFFSVNEVKELKTDLICSCLSARWPNINPIMVKFLLGDKTVFSDITPQSSNTFAARAEDFRVLFGCLSQDDVAKVEDIYKARIKETVRKRLLGD